MFFVVGEVFNNFMVKYKAPFYQGFSCSVSDNKCFVNSLEKYCKVELLGRFVLCEGLTDEH